MLQPTRQIGLRGFMKRIFILLPLLLSIQCTNITIRQPSNTFNKAQTSDWIQELPGDDKEYFDLVKRQIVWNKKNKLTSQQLYFATTRISKYLSFLMYNYPQSLTKRKVAEKTLSRILQSSTQFILCPQTDDFGCIEKYSFLQPAANEKIEDPQLRLGEVVKVDKNLQDSLEWHFNTQMFVPENQYQPENGVARVLERKIQAIGQNPETDAIYMALYGVDDIYKTEKSPGSLSGVYQSLISQIQRGTPVYGVFDHKGPNPKAEKPLIMSYVRPNDELISRWAFAPLNMKSISKSYIRLDQTNLDFQYNAGTQGLIAELSRNIQSDEQARGRVEWKNSGIMHNKFLIMKNNNQWSVWTGTANISRTCLGTERNSNLSVIINNEEIAKTYLDEFKEMYEFQKPTPVNKDLKPDVVGLNDKNYPYGRFHTAKRPNTKRYFYFTQDQTSARVYFSPTDDAEHRAILPMLHSAAPGDKIIISMFGAAGIEYVRAIQWAAARGVTVEIIVDSPTACGPGSWAGKTGDATLIEKNPFEAYTQKPALPIVMKKNIKGTGETWKQNHQKIGLLLRKISDTDYQAEYLTFGSQNWSNSGNDLNDENLVILHNKHSSLKIGEDFRNHFEKFLWPKAQVVPPSGCTDDGKAEEE